MENKYTGEVPLNIGDKKGVLVYDWNALALVRSNLTQQEMDNLAQLHPEKLALLTAAGFKKKNPEITAEVIMEISPPIMELANAVDRALLFAYHGPEAARQILEPMDKAIEEMTKKKQKNEKKKTQ